jgi:uncharacterized protein
MEDILASIRRILNEDETPATANDPVDAPADDDVLVLDQSMMVAIPEPASDVFKAEAPPQPVEPGPRPEPKVEAVPPPAAEPPQPAAETATAPPPTAPPEPPPSTAELIGAAAAAAAALSVGSLVRTLSAGRGTQVYSGGPTLEDMVRAEMRPLLKEWLDANLPALVERLARAEIERVIGRAVP